MTRLVCTAMVLLLTAACLHAQTPGFNANSKRHDELRKEIWDNNNKDFAATVVPVKWKDESAVIIAQANILSYRKTVLINNLNYNSYVHKRVKLQDTKAVEKFAEHTIPANGQYGLTQFEFYAGFKIIKSDGRVIEVPLSTAVKNSRKLNSQSMDEYKLAIPNLEVGDILDYYMAQDRTITLYSKYFAFDPVIFELNEDYPIMKRSISFEVLRRCYINAISLNGAPELVFKEDKERDKNFYVLQDANREAVKDTRWLYPYRDLPSIKFKVSYASAATAAYSVGFLGEPGIIKSSVTADEVKSLVSSVFGYTSIYMPMLKSEMNKYNKGLKDTDKLAREAFYRLRHILRIKDAETNLLNKGNDNEDGGSLTLLSTLSAYYRAKKIDHQIIIGIPRNISVLNDLILENELTFMIKVNTPKPFYIGRFDNHGIAGEIDTDLQGQEVYSAYGTISPSLWRLGRISIPVENFINNGSESVYQVSLNDLDEGLAEASITHTHKGATRAYYQNLLIDAYDYLDDETKHLRLIEKPAKMNVLTKKKKDDYLSRRDELKSKNLQAMARQEFGESLDTTRNLKIIQLGRFDDAPEFKYSFDASFKDVTKRVGKNYLVNIGKLMEELTPVKSDERARQHNIYMPYARQFKNRVEIQIPQGFKVQDIDKLNRTIENTTGGFLVTAKLEAEKLIVETTRYYKSNYEPVENWPKLLAILDAAYDFTQQQVLLQKE